MACPMPMAMPLPRTPVRRRLKAMPTTTIIKVTQGKAIRP